MRFRGRARGEAIERPVFAELLIGDEDRRAIEAQDVTARAKDGGHDRVGRRDAGDDPHHLLERGILGDTPLQSGDQTFALVAELPELAEPAVQQERGEPEDRNDEDRALERRDEPERGRPERGDGEVADGRDRGCAPRADGAEAERAGDDDDHGDEVGHPPGVAREEEHRDDQDGQVAGVGDRGDAAMPLQGGRATGGAQHDHAVRDDRGAEQEDAREPEVREERPEEQLEHGRAPANARDGAFDALSLAEESFAHRRLRLPERERDDAPHH